MYVCTSGVFASIQQQQCYQISISLDGKEKKKKEPNCENLLPLNDKYSICECGVSLARHAPCDYQYITQQSFILLPDLTHLWKNAHLSLTSSFMEATASMVLSLQPASTTMISTRDLSWTHTQHTEHPGQLGPMQNAGKPWTVILFDPHVSTSTHVVGSTGSESR